MSGAAGQPNGAGLTGGDTWRPRRAQVVTLAIAATLLVTCVVVWFAFPPAVRATFTWPQAATLILVLGFIDASLVAYSRCSVRVRPEGLVLRNVWRRRRIPWSDIEAVRYRIDDPWPMLMLTGDRRVGVMGIQTADGPRARADAAEFAAAVRVHLPAPG